MELAGKLSDTDRRVIIGVVRQRFAAYAWAWWAVAVGMMAFSAAVDQVSPAALRWLPGLCGFALFWFTFLSPNRRITTAPYERLERVTLNAENVECHADGSYLRFDWRRVKSTHRARNVVLLLLDNGQYVPLLRSWAADDAAWSEAITTLNQRTRG